MKQVCDFTVALPRCTDAVVNHDNVVDSLFDLINHTVYSAYCSRRPPPFTGCKLSSLASAAPLTSKRLVLPSTYSVSYDVSCDLSE